MHTSHRARSIDLIFPVYTAAAAAAAVEKGRIYKLRDRRELCLYSFIPHFQITRAGANNPSGNARYSYVFGALKKKKKKSAVCTVSRPCVYFRTWETEAKRGSNSAEREMECERARSKVCCCFSQTKKKATRSTSAHEYSPDLHWESHSGNAWWPACKWEGRPNWKTHFLFKTAKLHSSKRKKKATVSDCIHNMENFGDYAYCVCV